MLTKDRILRSLKPPDIPGSGGTHVRRWNGGTVPKDMLVAQMRCHM